MLVLDAHKLQDQQVNGPSDLQNLIPGFTDVPASDRANITLRGVGTFNQQLGTELGVGYYTDGVFVTTQGAIQDGFFDVNRVEVLRGPQGGLYGRNAMGGAINVISNEPTSNFEAGGDLAVGNYGFVQSNLYLSGPLSQGTDVLEGRFAFQSRNDAGYTQNIFNGQGLDNQDFLGFRGRLRYQPTDKIRLDFIFEAIENDSVPAWFDIPGPNGEPNPLLVAAGGVTQGRVVDQDSENYNRRTTQLYAINFQWDLNGARLSFLTSYRGYLQYQAADLDGGPAPQFAIPAEKEAAFTYTEELNLASTAPGRLQWLLGASYIYDSESEHGSFNPFVIFVPLYYNVNSYHTGAEAVYGQIQYYILPKLDLTAELRYSYDSKNIHASELYPEFPIGNSYVNVKGDWAKFTPKITLSYEFSKDLLLYATWGEGFKGGGFNGYAQNISFGPETVTNYEVGVKSSLFDDHLVANLSAFEMLYTNMQVEVPVYQKGLGIDLFEIQNAARSSIKGIEFELNGQPVTGLGFDLTGSYLDAHYTDFPDAVNGATVVDVTGNQLQNTPKWALYGDIHYLVPLKDVGDFTFMGSYSWRSRVYFTAFQYDVASQPAYGLLNASVTFQRPESKWSFVLWGKNLSNTNYDVWKTLTITQWQAYLGDPRTFGFTLRCKY